MTGTSTKYFNRPKAIWEGFGKGGAKALAKRLTREGGGGRNLQREWKKRGGSGRSVLQLKKKRTRWAA